ncbi:hypothetical protein PPYR_13692 [Photinus pyralis]|nr:hypothetical protein PPYR_13692 [Photinus pyralis]
MGVMGGCRRHELHQMTMSNINDLGSAVIVTIPNTRTKFLRTFTITGYHYEFFKKYADLRPDNITDSSFFLNYRNGRCGTMRVGINKFGAMGKVIAKYLKLPNPELYTGHNFRKSCATVLVDSDEYLASSRANRKKSAESCELISCKPTADLVEDAAVVRKVENIYEECVMDDDPLDIKYDEFNENKYVAAANNAQTSISPSSSKTQLYENQSNVSFEYNLKHLPKLIFNNCTNVTINVIHNNK